MIQLGALLLPDELIWEGEFDQINITADKEITVSGDSVFFEQALSEGRDIDLVATENTGWLTGAQAESLQNMIQPGSEYTLIFEDRQFMVRFRHEDSPVLEMQPVLPRPDPDSDDYYFGRIKLKEV